jgi:hypothetical protein
LCLGPGRAAGGDGRRNRKHADDFHLIEILERGVFKIGQLTSDDEMEQLLLGTIWHDPFS